jgi:prenyltransferase beta subunit
VNGAVNALKYFGGELTDKEKVQKFVMSCYDAQTGAFAEPGDKPTVTMTSVGVLAATAVGIDKAKYKKAMEYLEKNAKTFEDYRIGAAAIEAYGVKESGIDVGSYFSTAFGIYFGELNEGKSTKAAVGAASLTALKERLGVKLEPTDVAARLLEPKAVLLMIQTGQAKDGGWAKDGAKSSDAETTYRVMRALMLLSEKPKDADGVAKFVASCRRKDGGYGVDAEAASSMSGVYYAAKIGEWLK